MAQSSGRLSPRQRMINLMYIVLTAMLALNVSSDVLEGFSQVEEGLRRSNNTVTTRNDAILAKLTLFSEQNPEKGTQWLNKALEVREATDLMIDRIDSLKWLIVRAADGKNADINNINRRDDLESASVVMLNPSTLRGEQLRGQIDSYRDFISTIVTDTAKMSGIAASLSTDEEPIKGSGVKRLWEVAKFENQPVVAAVTLLTKLENDVRFAEGEALSALLANVDAGDVRVNELNAFVIPQSRFVMRGEKYSANIVLAAVDTTARPTIFVGQEQLPDSHGLYEFTTSRTGSFDYSGHLEVAHGDGTVTSHPFSSSYVVMEPSATVSATMMNVLYAGIDNPISISVPGVPNGNVSASMTNGSLVRSGDGWVARPGKVGEDAVVTVSASMNGGASRPVSSMTFRVRSLPDPTAYINLGGEGGDSRYKGGRPISKARLTAAKGLGAAIDDGVLDIDFKVTGFETVVIDGMGNNMIEQSAGNQFSSRQIEAIKRLNRGKRFYISRIKAIGPDGSERILSPVEVIIN